MISDSEYDAVIDKGCMDCVLVCSIHTSLWTSACILAVVCYAHHLLSSVQHTRRQMARRPCKKSRGCSSLGANSFHCLTLLTVELYMKWVSHISDHDACVSNSSQSWAINVRILVLVGLENPSLFKCVSWPKIHWSSYAHDVCLQRNPMSAMCLSRAILTITCMCAQRHKWTRLCNSTNISRHRKPKFPTAKFIQMPVCIVCVLCDT